jgi:phage-related protein
MQKEIVFFGNHFLDFYLEQDKRTKEKIDFVLDLIRNVERVPIKFLKYLEGTNGLYEIKIITQTKSLRIFCFFDEGKLVVLINGFVKKTNKTPKKEIEMGNKLKQEYFTEKAREKK